MKYDINEVNRHKERILNDLRALKMKYPDGACIPIDKYQALTNVEP